MSQTRKQSLIEAWANIVVGLGLAMLANVVLFPKVLHVEVTTEQNLTLGAALTLVSLARSYSLRRLFNRWHR